MQALVAVNRYNFETCFDPEDVKRLADKVALAPKGLPASLPEHMTAEWISEHVTDAEILITGWGTPALTDALIDRAAKLRAIVHSAGSVKYLVPPRAFARNIAVTNARAVLAQGVAETSLAMIIAACKMFMPLARGVGQGHWRDQPWTEWVIEPYQITIGVIAASEVGKRLLKLLRSFEVERLVYDPYATDELIANLGARKVDLNHLCSESDVIVICAPATEETHHMIGAGQLALMKDRARLINAARGSLIDESALIKELAKGRLYAVLDVTDPEPPAPNSPLRTSPYCLLCPHIAGHVNNGRRRQGWLVVGEILKFLADGRFEWQVTPEALARMA